MAKKTKKKKNGNDEGFGLQTGTKHGILAVIFFVLALFFLMSAFDLAGVAGRFFYREMYYLLGVGYILLPFLFILLGISFLKSVTPNIGWARTISSILFLLSSLGMIDIASTTHAGGLLGRILSTPLVSLFDVYASIAFLGAIFIISILVMFDEKLEIANIFKRILNIFRKEKVEEVLTDKEMEQVEEVEEEEEETSSAEKIKKALGMKKKEIEEEEEEIPIRKRKDGLATYIPPPLSLLEEDQGKPNTGDIKANANIIKRTLANFGIEVEMDEITVGPTVTRYALKPAEGVKLSRIIGLQNDLALSLAAHPIRI